MFIRSIPVGRIRFASIAASAYWHQVATKCSAGDFDKAIQQTQEATSKLRSCGLIALPCLLDLWIKAIQSGQDGTRSAAIEQIGFIKAELDRLIEGQVLSTGLYLEHANKLVDPNSKAIPSASDFFLPAMPNLKLLSEPGQVQMEFGCAVQASRDYATEMQSHILSYFKAPKSQTLSAIRTSIQSVVNRNLKDPLGLLFLLTLAWIDGKECIATGLAKPDILFLMRVNNAFKHNATNDKFGNDSTLSALISETAYRLLPLVTKRAVALCERLGLKELAKERPHWDGQTADRHELLGVWQKCSDEWDSFFVKPDSANLLRFVDSLNMFLVVPKIDASITLLLKEMRQVCDAIKTRIEQNTFDLAEAENVSDVLASIPEIIKSKTPDEADSIVVRQLAAITQPRLGGKNSSTVIDPIFPKDDFYAEVSKEIQTARAAWDSHDWGKLVATLEVIVSSLAIVQHTDVGAVMINACQLLLEDCKKGDESVANPIFVSSLDLFQQAIDLVSNKEDAAVALLDRIVKIHNKAAVRMADVDRPDDLEIFDIFVVEAYDICSKITGFCEQIQKTRVFSIKDAEFLRRHWHTLKGSSRMAGLMNLSNIALHLEKGLSRAIDSNVIEPAWLDSCVINATRMINLCEEIKANGFAVITLNDVLDIGSNDIVQSDVADATNELEVTNEHETTVLATQIDDDFAKTELAQINGEFAKKDLADITPTDLISINETEWQDEPVTSDARESCLSEGHSVGTTAFDLAYLNVDRDVMVAFVKESQEIAAALIKEVVVVLEGQMTYEMVRASHSMGGMARIIGLHDLEVLCDSVEKWSSYLMSSELAPSPEALRVLPYVAKEINSIVTHFVARKSYSANTGLADALLRQGSDAFGAESLCKDAPVTNLAPFGMDDADSTVAKIPDMLRTSQMLDEDQFDNALPIPDFPSVRGPITSDFGFCAELPVVPSSVSIDSNQANFTEDPLSDYALPLVSSAISDASKAQTASVAVSEAIAPDEGARDDPSVDVFDFDFVNEMSSGPAVAYRSGVYIQKEPGTCKATLEDLADPLFIDGAVGKKVSDITDAAATTLTSENIKISRIETPIVALDFSIDPDAIDDVDGDVLVAYMAEAEESLSDMDHLIADFVPGISSFTEINRILHTLKGGARLCGLLGLGSMLHKMEDATSLNSGVTDVEATHLIQRIQRAMDQIRSVLNAAVHNLDNEDVDRQDITDKTVLTTAMPVRQESRTLLRIDPHKIDELSDLLSQIRITQDRVSRRSNDGLKMFDAMKSPIQRLTDLSQHIAVDAETQMDSGSVRNQANSDFDALEMDRFSTLQEHTRRLLEAVHDVQNIFADSKDILDDVQESIDQQIVISGNVQSHLDQIGRSSLLSAEARMKATVRQSAEDCSRQCKLEIDGDATIDRAVMDKLIPAIEHLLRNSVAHGIEPSEQRTGAGKDASGLIRLTTRRDGSYAVITLSDDGAGVNFDKVRKKAIAIGLVNAAQIISNDELVDFLFSAGFTTADHVTNVAGRGVGLDSVKSTINRLGGRISLTSQTGKGTVFEIQVPLSSGYVTGLMIEASKSPYIIPSAFIKQVEMVDKETLTTNLPMPGSEISLADGTKKALYDISFVCGSGARCVAGVGRFNQVIVPHFKGNAVVYGENLEYINNLPLRNFSAETPVGRGVIGYSLLSDGRIAVVINPDELLGMLERLKLNLNLPLQPPSQMPLVLVVDDSITVRTVTSRLLIKNGYRCETAENGLIALEKINKECPAAVLMDIEMPVMDGFEATKAIKATHALSNVPVAIISSRNADKHKSYAASIGASVFFGKPYNDVELIDWVRSVTTSTVAA